MTEHISNQTGLNFVVISLTCTVQETTVLNLYTFSHSFGSLEHAAWFPGTCSLFLSVLNTTFNLLGIFRRFLVVIKISSFLGNPVLSS